MSAQFSVADLQGSAVRCEVLGILMGWDANVSNEKFNFAWGLGQHAIHFSLSQTWRLRLEKKLILFFFCPSRIIGFLSSHISVSSI